MALVYLLLIVPIAVKGIAGYRAGKPPAADNTHSIDAYRNREGGPSTR
jgi:hypothetical protein